MVTLQNRKPLAGKSVASTLLMAFALLSCTVSAAAPSFASLPMEHLVPFLPQEQGRQLLIGTSRDISIRQSAVDAATRRYSCGPELPADFCEKLGMNNLRVLKSGRWRQTSLYHKTGQNSDCGYGAQYVRLVVEVTTDPTSWTRASLAYAAKATNLVDGTVPRLHVDADRLHKRFEDVTAVECAVAQKLENAMPPLLQGRHVVRCLGLMDNGSFCVANSTEWSRKYASSFLMEKVQSETLDIKKKPTSELLAAFRSVLRPLIVMHEKLGLAHQDVKFQNIFKHGRDYKLGDFDALSTAVFFNGFRCTDDYGPPEWEQFWKHNRGNSAYGVWQPARLGKLRTHPSYDIYSLGVMLEQVYEKSEFLPAELMELIVQMKHLDPWARPTAREVLCHSAWFPLLGESGWDTEGTFIATDQRTDWCPDNRSGKPTYTFEDEALFGRSPGRKEVVAKWDHQSIQRVKKTLNKYLDEHTDLHSLGSWLWSEALPHCYELPEQHEEYVQAGGPLAARCSPEFLDLLVMLKHPVRSRRPSVSELLSHRAWVADNPEAGGDNFGALVVRMTQVAQVGHCLQHSDSSNACM